MNRTRTQESRETTLEACSLALQALEERLQSYSNKEVAADDTLSPDASRRSGASVRSKMTRVAGAMSAASVATNTSQVQEKGDFAYTIAAARRSELRRLARYVKLSDYMICSTLRTVLLDSLKELHEVGFGQ